MRVRSDEATLSATMSGSSSLSVSVCDGTRAHGAAPDQPARDPHGAADLASGVAAHDRAHADTSQSSASNSSGSSRSSRRGKEHFGIGGAHLVRERQKSEPTDLLDTAELAALSAPADSRRNDPIFARAAQGRESAMATEANAAGLSKESEGTKEREARHCLDHNEILHGTPITAY